MHRSATVLLAWLLAATPSAERGKCPEYTGMIVAPDGWEYLQDLDVFSSRDVTASLMNELKHQFLDGRKVSVFNCSVPVDNIDCHHDNLVGPSKLQLGGGLPEFTAAIDFECFQGLMSSSRVVAVDLPATNGSSFDGNFTVRFGELKGTFTIHLASNGGNVPINLGPINVPIPLPPINDEEPLQLDGMSVTIVFPLRGQCNEQSRRFKLYLGELHVSNLDLGVEDVHPLHNTLVGPIGNICGNLGQKEFCDELLKNVDVTASATLERELVQIVPALVANELGDVLQEVVRDSQLTCLPRSVEHVVRAVSEIPGNSSATTEVTLLIVGFALVLFGAVGLLVMSFYGCNCQARSKRFCAYSDLLRNGAIECLDVEREATPVAGERDLFVTCQTQR